MRRGLQLVKKTFSVHAIQFLLQGGQHVVGNSRLCRGGRAIFRNDSFRTFFGTFFGAKLRFFHNLPNGIGHLGHAAILLGYGVQGSGKALSQVCKFFTIQFGYFTMKIHQRSLAAGAAKHHHIGRFAFDLNFKR